MDKKTVNVNNVSLLFWISSIFLWLILAVFIYFADPLFQLLWIFTLLPMAIISFWGLVNIILIFLYLIWIGKEKRNSVRQFIILLILNYLIPILLIISPLSLLYRKNEFKIMKEDRVNWVRAVMKDSSFTNGLVKSYIKTSEGLTSLNCYQLTDAYKQLSVTGLVSVEEDKDDMYFVFYYKAGMNGGYTAYVYSVFEDNLPESDLFPGTIYNREKLDENWYLIKAY